MRHVDLTIEGISSLMTFPFTDSDLESISKGETEKSRKGERDSVQERAAKKVYYGKVSGKPIIPKALLDACFKASAEALKIKEPFACMEVHEEEVEIISSGPWEIDKRSAVNPHTKGRIDVVRPIWYDWRLSFTLAYDEEIISLIELRNVVDHAGVKKGIGSFRPSKKGGFGKFKVVEWENLMAEPVRPRFTS